MSLSQDIVRGILKDETQEEIIENLGFITTVLRDNEVDNELYTYYQAVLTYLDRAEPKE